MLDLLPHQEEAIKKLDNGKILWGGVGSGKSLTVLSYYIEKESPRDIYVITTAKKRDALDWVGEAAKLGISTERDATIAGVIHVDSWNNIHKYTDIEDAFFVFDEQRVVGTGSWVKSFLKITKKNQWVLLSATPGDVWLDYAPVFVANGYFRNITDFKMKHVLYEPYLKYAKVRGYIGVNKLEELRNEVLVEMPFITHTERMLNYLPVGYDKDLYKNVMKRRWHIYEQRPIKDVAEMFRVLRKICNTDRSRLENVKMLMKVHPRLVIFYNFNYELEILRGLDKYVDVFEWNGHKKDPLPTGENWVYLVQYVAGAEGWNCTSTDAMILYSLTYSYKNFVQAQGRIDRLNTEFKTLYYYIFASNSEIDVAIKNSLTSKQSFNEKNFGRKYEKYF